MVPEIALAERAEQRARHGVQQDVAVRVPLEAAVAGDLDAAEHQRAAGTSRCASNPWPILTPPPHALTPLRPRFRSALRRGEILGVRSP